MLNVGMAVYTANWPEFQQLRPRLSDDMGIALGQLDRRDQGGTLRISVGAAERTFPDGKNGPHPAPLPRGQERPGGIA